jgi:hypothetical protein
MASISNRTLNHNTEFQPSTFMMVTGKRCREDTAHGGATLATVVGDFELSQDNRAVDVGMFFPVSVRSKIPWNRIAKAAASAHVDRNP